MEGWAPCAVRDACGDIPRPQVDRPGLGFSKGQVTHPPHGTKDRETHSHLRWGGRRRDGGQGLGAGRAGGMAAGCQGATHRSRAVGTEPSRPLPAVPLLEHAASCEEFLVVEGEEAHSGLARRAEQGREGRIHHPALQRAAGKEVLVLGTRTQAQALTPTVRPSQHPHCPPQASPVCRITFSYGPNCTRKFLC